LFIFASTIIRLAIDSSIEEKKKIKIEKERLLIEAKYLRTQMNPHFFLNALNNLQSITHLSPEITGEYINVLAEMMRYVTYDCKNNLVSIEKEIAYIKNYIYFQQIKDDDTAVELNIALENYEIKIEPMLLMPFIENAFKYGVLDEKNAHPIKIELSQKNAQLLFHCSNKINLNRNKNNDPSYSGLGIQNVKNRLKVNYPNKHNLNILNNGTEFIVDLSLQKEVTA
jgi:LytS/YehU family sensor histidine kinase